ncbi:MAG: CDP-diacylglycerol--glycerol-3-phosphate 3-phosphatidyltransferase [Nitrospirales bacterium]|nr:CDP-diacylglycerol--glycerol-3-phosphate 3-phosphatidyltransferase [Nitrospirales bacterium]
MANQRAYKIKPSLSECDGRETYLNLPNTLTVSRILVIPVFVFLFSSPTPERAVAAALVFLVAALTDLLDGYLARRRGQITNLGKLLDPVADKLLVASALILLVQFQRVEVWLAIVMIARELIVTGARAVAAKEGFVVPADSMGKLKVVGQISGILCLILEEVIRIPFIDLHLIGTLVLYMALTVALISASRYLFEILKKISPQFL